MLRFDATKIIQQVREAADEVLVVSAYDVLDISQQFVPVDTGALKASGRVEIERTTDQKTAYIAYGDGLPVYDGNQTYANAQEFGTVNMAAQPYLTPAMAQAESIVDARAREILKDIDK